MTPVIPPAYADGINTLVFNEEAVNVGDVTG